MVVLGRAVTLSPMIIDTELPSPMGMFLPSSGRLMEGFMGSVWRMKQWREVNFAKCLTVVK